MRTKILMSILMIGVVAIGAGAGTLAYFSDVEKSTGNTFTAGKLDLKIDSECHFNGMDCTDNTWGDTSIPCYCVWTERDLTSQKFFYFTNLKPGDSGEATISMHVIGDDAYVRFKVDNVENNDNGCNIPERTSEIAAYGAGSATCGNPGPGQGELGKNMDFAIWFDMGNQWGYQGKTVDSMEGDNILNGVELSTLVNGSGDGTAGVWVELKNPTTGEYIPFGDSKTYYIGVAWCVGSMADPLAGDLTCDGSTAWNIIQSDSYSSDSTFQVQQASNNPTPIWP